MAPPTVAAPDGDAATTEARATPRRSLLVHLSAAVIIAVLVTMATTGAGAFSSDEGAYHLQLEALDAGSWEWHSGTEALDSDGASYPILYASQTASGYAPIPKHPLWPTMATWTSVVTGRALAYAVLGSLAMLGTALAAWCLAGARGRRWQPAAFWIAFLSPVTVTAALGWAHGWAAMAAGWAVAGAVALTGSSGSEDAGSGDAGPGAPLRPGWATLALFGGTAVGVLVRSEGVLVAVALALAVIVAGRIRWRDRIGISVGLIGLVALVGAVEAAWITRITGAGSSTLAPRTGGGVAAGFLEGRVLGAWHLLGDAGEVGAGWLVPVAVAVLFGVSVWTGRRAARDGWRSATPTFAGCSVAAVVVVVALVLRFFQAPTTPVPGLVPAWPIAAVGLGLLVGAGRAWDRYRMEVTFSVLYLGAILATQYADGGGVQWGGRFLAPLVVPVAVLVAGAADLLERRSVPAVTKKLAVVLLVLPTVVGVGSVWSTRHSSARVFSQVAAAVPDRIPTLTGPELRGIAVTTNPHLPRMMWADRLPWLVIDDADDQQLARLTARLDRSSIVRISVVGPDAEREADRLLAGLPGWSATPSAPTSELPVVTIER